MRILHTSDWHLGRSFGPISLAADQREYVEWLVEQCADRAIDLVVIAGDIYDRAIPPTEAVVLLRKTLSRLLDANLKVAAITGNHDAAERVAAYDDLLDLSGLFLRGGYSRLGEVITVEFHDGPLDIVLLPFLDPQAAPEGFVDATTTHDDDDGVDQRVRRTHDSVLAAATAAVRPLLTSPRSLAIAHAFVAGGQQSESERQLTVGGTGQVDASVFDGFSYTALGHLHRPQPVGDSDVVRYSGTPLAYSFSEQHQKSITIVDMASDGTCTVEQVNIPVGRPVLTVTGTIKELLAKKPSAAEARAFVRAIVTDRETVLDAKASLSRLYPHIVEVKLQPVGVNVVGDEAPPEIRELSPLEATFEFWRAAEGSDPDDAMGDLLVEVVTAGVNRTSA